MGSAISSISPWFATTSLTAPELRLAMGALWAPDPNAAVAVEAGVVPAASGPFVLTSNGTAAAPRVSVAPGQIIHQRPNGGPYVSTWPVAGNISLDLPLPSSGQSRIDLLVAEIVDTEADGGATNPPTFNLRLVTVPGTGSSSPVAPTPGAGQIPLWRWQVNNGGAITNIISLRPWTRTVGGVRFVEDGDTRAGSYPGDLRIFRTGQIDAWLQVNSVWQWQIVVPPPIEAALTFTVNSAGYSPNDSTRPLRAFVDSRGAVRLAGFIRRTSANTGVAAGTQYQLNTPAGLLPAAIRPNGYRDMPGVTSFGPVCITVRPDGGLYFMTYAAATLIQNQSWWSFDSCTYQLR